MTRLVRLLDCDLNFVRALEEHEVDAMLGSGRAEYRQMGRKRVALVLLDKRTVTDFRRGSADSNPGGPALQSTYRETHAHKSINISKRAVFHAEKPKVRCISGDKHPDTFHTLHKWDNGLTFDELRAGQLVSQAERDRKAMADWRRKNLVIALTRYPERSRLPQAA